MTFTEQALDVVLVTIFTSIEEFFVLCGSTLEFLTAFARRSTGLHGGLEGSLLGKKVTYFGGSLPSEQPLYDFLHRWINIKAFLAEDPNDDQQRFWGLFQVKWQEKLISTKKSSQVKSSIFI